MTGPAAPVAMYGLRCTNPLHPGYQTVYANSPAGNRLRRLAESNACYELVVSHDGEKTWEACDDTDR